MVPTANLVNTYEMKSGLTIDDQTDENGEVVFHDDSDASKDRLWTGTGMYSFTEQGSFLYKVGD